MILEINTKVDRQIKKYWMGKFLFINKTDLIHFLCFKKIYSSLQKKQYLKHLPWQLQGKHCH